MAASGLKTAEAARLINSSTRGTAYVEPTTPTKAELTTTAPTATTNGTAVTGGSYADQSFSTVSSDTSTASIANTTAISYTGMPAATVVGANLKDSNGSPRYAWWGVFGTSITTLAGDTITFAIGALTFAINNTP